MSPTPDEAAIAFWRRCEAHLGETSGPVPPIEQFGDSPDMADRLLSLVLDGPKRATASAVVEYEHEGEPVPELGDRWIVVDGRGTPRAVLQSTDVRIGPLSSVDAAFAWDEGEGDRTVEDWLRAHNGYFGRHLPTIGVEFDPDLLTVFERFEIVYAETAD